MCDWRAVQNWLVLLALLLAVIIALILAAVIANESIVEIYNSPILLGIAGGVAILGITVCGFALKECSIFETCAAPKCIAEVNTIRSTIIVLMIQLGTHVVAIVLAVIPALIPIVGGFIAALIIIPIGISVGLLIWLMGTPIYMLSNCQGTTGPSP